MIDKPFLETEVQPVTYENGDHCIFYTVQDAKMFFYNKPLTTEDRNIYQTQRKRIVDIARGFMGDTISLHWVTASLRILIQRLEENSISISEINCGKRIEEFLEKDNAIKRNSIPIHGIEGNFKIEFPSLIIMQEKGGPGHVWCTTSDEEFRKDYSKHVSSNSVIGIVAKLEKSSQEIKGT
jgi:hypothetical protein